MSCTHCYDAFRRGYNAGEERERERLSLGVAHAVLFTNRTGGEELAGRAMETVWDGKRLLKLAMGE